MRYSRLLLIPAFLFALSALAQETKKPPEPLKIKVGDVAPDFTLLAFDGQKVTPVALHDYKGRKNVALASGAVPLMLKQ